MENYTSKHAINDEDDGDLLGFIVQNAVGWQAQTVFGYPISRASSQVEAAKIVHQKGRNYLKGVWQYLDDDDGSWYPCVIKSANELQVTVTRTSPMGFQEINDSKLVIIRDPSELNLQKT